MLFFKSNKLQYFLIEVDRSLDNYNWTKELLLVIDDGKGGGKFREAIKPCYTSKIQKLRKFKLLRKLNEETATMLAAGCPLYCNQYYIYFSQNVAIPSTMGDGRFIDKPNIIIVKREYR